MIVGASFADTWHVEVALGATVLGVVATVVVAGVYSRLRREVAFSQRADFWLWVCLSAWGAWATVPDTEAPLFIAAFLTPLLALGFRSGVGVSPLWGAMALAVVAYGAWAGSAMWATALLGALCCLLVPAIAVPSRTLTEPGILWAKGRVAVLMTHIAATVIGSRVVAHSSTMRAWWVTAIVVCAVSAVTARVLVSARARWGANDE